jgi:ureidoglycolate dehydrogenase (NAD+)
MRVPYNQLEEFTSDLLREVGLDDFSTKALTLGLCESSLRGVDSHGIRLLPHYINSALSGRKNPTPNMQYTQVFPAFGKLDADNAFGHAAGMKAIDHAMKMAETFGMGAVTVLNSSHPGAMASYALKAARQGYIAFAFTHADALTVSYNAKRAYFGTNPLCMAAPRKDMEPYCLDMAPTQATWNKIRMYKSAGEEIPANTVVDNEGLPTQNPNAAAALSGIGEYKGFGLASMVEILCGVVSGMPFGRQIPKMFEAPMEEPRHLAQFFMVMRPDVCMSGAEFEQRMRQMSEEISDEPQVGSEPVMLPGDREIKEAKVRIKEGIPVDAVTWGVLEGFAKQFNMEMPYHADLVS